MCRTYIFFNGLIGIIEDVELPHDAYQRPLILTLIFIPRHIHAGECQSAGVERGEEDLS